MEGLGWLTRCYVTFTTVWECSIGRKCYVLNLGNKDKREKIFGCIADHELAYICEKIILEQLKNNFRLRSLWPCHTSGGRSPSANKLKFIKNTGI